MYRGINTILLLLLRTLRVFGVLPMVPLVGNICTIGTNLITNGTIGKEIGANGNAISTNSTNVTNQWYHWENPEHTQCSKQK